MTPHRRRQRLASVEHIEPGHAEVQPARGQIAEQLTDHGGILGGSFAQAQHRFAPVDVDTQGHDHLPVAERPAHFIAIPMSRYSSSWYSAAKASWCVMTTGGVRSAACPRKVWEHLFHSSDEVGFPTCK